MTTKETTQAVTTTTLTVLSTTAQTTETSTTTATSTLTTTSSTPVTTRTVSADTAILVFRQGMSDAYILASDGKSMTPVNVDAPTSHYTKWAPFAVVRDVLHIFGGQFDDKKGNLSFKNPPHDNCRNSRFWNQDPGQPLMKFQEFFFSRDS